MSIRVVHTEPQWLNPTYVEEIWGEMDDWCRQHCRGTFELLSPEEGVFELEEDKDRFVDHWWGHGKARLVEPDPAARLPG